MVTLKRETKRPGDPQVRLWDSDVRFRFNGVIAKPSRSGCSQVRVWPRPPLTQCSLGSGLPCKVIWPSSGPRENVFQEDKFSSGCYQAPGGSFSQHKIPGEIPIPWDYCFSNKMGKGRGTSLYLSQSLSAHTHTRSQDIL